MSPGGRLPYCASTDPSRAGRRQWRVGGTAAVCSPQRQNQQLLVPDEVSACEFVMEVSACVESVMELKSWFLRSDLTLNRQCRFQLFSVRPP